MSNDYQPKQLATELNEFMFKRQASQSAKNRHLSHSVKRYASNSPDLKFEKKPYCGLKKRLQSSLKPPPPKS